MKKPSPPEKILVTLISIILANLCISVYSHVNCDINMKFYIKCCGGENGEALGHIMCEYGTHTEHLKHLRLTDAIQQYEI